MDVVIPAGRVVEVDTLQAEARSVTVEGTLRAIRNGSSQLTLYGNLVVQKNGVLDYGRPNDRVTGTASIRWFLNEAAMIGGGQNVIVPSDIGLWATDDAQVWVHGLYRDTWTALTSTAAAGSREIAVDPARAKGWKVGDLIVVGPSNLRTGDTDFQDEVRRITADLGGGRFQLDSALRYAHEVITVPWTDTWGDVWVERLAAKVANLTSNITFEAGDPNHRPHVLFLNRAKHFVEDLAVVNFSPVPKVNPMGRYAWHNHRQKAGSQGSYTRRMRLYGGAGDGYHIHESHGVEVEDLVVYNQARVNSAGVRPFMLERDTVIDQQHHAADDCWVDRPLVMRWGLTNPELNDNRNSGFWLTGSVNCVVAGAVAAGGAGTVFSSGMHWDEGGAGVDETTLKGEHTFVYRAEAHSNRIAGFLSWQNNTPIQRIVDVLSWRNGETGFMWGAYQTRYWGHHFRSLGNRLAQFTHVAIGWGITGFLADGMGYGGAGIQIGRYVLNSQDDVVYEDGVVRNVGMNIIHASHPSSGGGISWVQFARVLWDAARGIAFGGSAVPPNTSRVRFRNQRGLPRASDFTLYRLGDTSVPAGAVTDTAYNALRVDNDTLATRGQAPRVKWVTPADESIVTGNVTLTVQTDAAQVEFFQANRSLGRVNVGGGTASIAFNMENHPRRRAYLWAQASINGVVHTSRVLRLSKF